MVSTTACGHHHVFVGSVKSTPYPSKESFSIKIYSGSTYNEKPCNYQQAKAKNARGAHIS